MTDPPTVRQPICTLLLFVATPAEEDGLERAAADLKVDYVKDATLTRYLQGLELEDARVLGTIGAETVVTVRPSRERGNVVMGAHGRRGSAAKAMRFMQATGAQGILQLGMAFGISPSEQKIGDVLVSAALIPYDNRDVIPAPDGSEKYVSDYSKLVLEFPRQSLLDRCHREKGRGDHQFGVHIGAMLSGSARIHCARFRDELFTTVSHGDEGVVGGEMEGVGLLAASLKADDPAWCVVKGISDFADENRKNVIVEGRKVAPYNAAVFVLSALRNDAADVLAPGDKT